jgi:hypothetical protein
VSHVKGRTQIEHIEKKVLRRIFVPNRYEVMGDLRKLHNEKEFHSFYFYQIFLE